MPLGVFSLILHAHLPFVRHPEHEDSLEERWLYEAITETYLPLLRVMEGWRRDQVDFRLTLSLSPPLISMLSDPFLQERYVQHLSRLIDLAESEVTRTSWLERLQPTARHYHEAFKACLDEYENLYRRDLVQGFASFQESGNLLLITSSATHAFLPLMQHQPAAVRAQIRIGVQTYQERLGQPPKGVWNAECGYYPGLDAALGEHGIGFFFVDAHGLLQASLRPRYGIFAPIRCPSGVAAFGRDVETSRIVWNAEFGYPSDPAYRDFYRDLGFDADFDYIAPFLHESGRRVATGIKYHRITGKVPLGKKDLYDPAEAQRRAEQHAADFVYGREEQARRIGALMDRPPLIVSPYDAELFGHWWYEGPVFLDHVMRRMCGAPDAILPMLPTEYLERYPENQTLTPVYSSWGEGGYAEVWLNPSNDWIYRYLHAAADRMVELARRRRGTPVSLERRALNQMARELLLAQSSDWAFIMRMGTVVDYATNRTKGHLENFNRLYEQVQSSTIDERVLSQLEARNNIFPRLEFEVYADDAAHRKH